MLVHRDYEAAQLAAIDVEPGVGITFKNPGGLPDSLVSRVTLDDAGRFRPVPNVSDLRNRSLCDVFFGIHVMEREGTVLDHYAEYLPDDFVAYTVNVLIHAQQPAGYAF